MPEKISALDEVLAARESIAGPGGPPPGWRPVQFSTVIQINMGMAATAAMVLDGAEHESMSPEEAGVVWRRSLASIAAVCMDALDATDA